MPLVYLVAVNSSQSFLTGTPLPQSASDIFANLLGFRAPPTVLFPFHETECQEGATLLRTAGSGSGNGETEDAAAAARDSGSPAAGQSKKRLAP